jgi:uncharacterized protein
MNDTFRISIFIAIVLSVWTLMHVYAGLRLSSVVQLVMPGPRRWLWLSLGALWLSYPVGRLLDRAGATAPGVALEWLGAVWMGTLFLLMVAFFAVDLLTGFGHLFKTSVPPARLAATCLALLLALVAAFQGLRGPAIRESEVRLAGLPANLDGITLVQVSDLHLGTLIGRRWLADRAAEVRALRPDIVVVNGDLVDGDNRKVEALLPEMRLLTARLGVFAVTGNHEYYAGLDRSVALLEAAGYTVLRDRHVEVAPGLVIAGVDDLTARRQLGLNGDPLARALDGRPAGAAILVSHTPWRVGDAAARGVGLMLCGHTHDGQIWPFGYLVHIQYPYLGGWYDTGGMKLLVSRGTGTWGPPMRLFRRSEINRITLRAQT